MVVEVSSSIAATRKDGNEAFWEAVSALQVFLGLSETSAAELVKGALEQRARFGQLPLLQVALLRFHAAEAYAIACATALYALYAADDPENDTYGSHPSAETSDISQQVRRLVQEFKHEWETSLASTSLPSLVWSRIQTLQDLSAKCGVEGPANALVKKHFPSSLVTLHLEKLAEHRHRLGSFLVVLAATGKISLTDFSSLTGSLSKAVFFVTGKAGISETDQNSIPAYYLLLSLLVSLLHSGMSPSFFLVQCSSYP